jgi:putative transposase
VRAAYSRPFPCEPHEREVQAPARHTKPGAYSPGHWPAVSRPYGNRVSAIALFASLDSSIWLLVCCVKVPRSVPHSEAQSHLVSGFHHRDHLPHLKSDGGSYFVTFRLAGTLPAAVMAQLKAEREAILSQALAAKRPLTWPEQEELFHWYSHRVDRHLDAGHGDCWMRQPEVAQTVADVLNFHAGQRFDLLAWVVMPNHVHAVLRPRSGFSLSQVLHSWKGYSAKKANELLCRDGEFWQGESYDHLIRDADDLHRCCDYTLTNPVTARLCARPEAWPWSSAYPTAS